MKKLWRTVEVEARADLGELSEILHPLSAQMLARRGILDLEEVKKFLEPDYDRDIHDPFLFKQMDAAVERIFKAVENNEHIVIHGDYDADGVTGSVVMAEAIKSIVARPTSHVARQEEDGKFFGVLDIENGVKLDIYIPHREKEGYGLNMDSVGLIAESGVDLLITVDCGIANILEIAKAKELGLDVIVVDHHQFGEILPDAILIHPRLPGEIYPFKDLAAVGVAWKVAQALMIKAREKGMDIQEGAEKWLLDLVSIATVTDIVSLKGENRVLEKYGLKVLNKLRRPGFKALVDIASWKKDELDSESVGFVIGPRINAAGRMEHAFLAVDLLSEQNPEEAARKATALEAINKSRQKATEELMKTAEGLTNGHVDHSLVVAWSDQWSPSLVGLAAGRYADKFGKPAVFVGKHGNTWIGSGRSIPDYDITQAVKEAGGEWLTRYGGHAQACGFSLAHDEYLELFAVALREHALKALGGKDLAPILKVEAELKFADINWKLWETLVKFEPYGEGNPKPIFMSTGLTVIEAALVGASQNHLRCTLADESGKKQKFIGFYRSDLLDIFQTGDKISVVYEVGVNEWNDRKEIQCKLIDARGM